ncbi:hypothetical protein BC832DRAFT_85886 [Gaertneriomyces semiglobifer]|nr:hypothetical protein BC832DRAFT_85886 [Gaertneriomyces semiglobifer]
MKWQAGFTVLLLTRSDYELFVGKIGINVLLLCSARTQRLFWNINEGNEQSSPKFGVKRPHGPYVHLFPLFGYNMREMTKSPQLESTDTDIEWPGDRPIKRITFTHTHQQPVSKRQHHHHKHTTCGRRPTHRH